MASVKFVRELELEEPSVLRSRSSTCTAAAVSDGKAQGLVDNGSLVSFASNVMGQKKQDVLYSTLLAQLAANKKYDRFNYTEIGTSFTLT